MTLSKNKCVSTFMSLLTFAIALSTIGTTASAAPTRAPAPAPAAGAPAGTTPAVQADSAEVCESQDGKQKIARGFGSRSATFAQLGRDPMAPPTIGAGYTYQKDARGFVIKDAVSPEMFQLMAEPFGGNLRPMSEWAATFEVAYEGMVRVMDSQNRHAGTFYMECNAPLVEYK